MSSLTKRRLTFWLVGLVFCLAVLYILLSRLSSLSNRQMTEAGKTLIMMRRAEIELIPAQLNAATYYRRALAKLEKTGWGSFFEDSETALSSPWNSQEFPGPAAIISKHPEIMELIRQGAKQQLCRGEVFPVLCESNSYSPWPIEEYYPQFTAFIIADLGLSLGEKGMDESIPTLKTTFEVLNHLEQKDVLIAAIMVDVCESRHLYPLLRNVLTSDRVTVPFCRTATEELTKLDSMAKRAISKRLVAESVSSTRWSICMAYGTSQWAPWEYFSSKKKDHLEWGSSSVPCLSKYYN